jgi:peptidyl-prolyl cis-trans isomerase SurA
MTFRSYLIILWITVLPAMCLAQDLNVKILMTIGESGTEAGEFIRMYRKSHEPGKPLPVDDYLQQFSLFKQKVADAVSEGYDTTRTYKNELNGYRNQLAQNYLTDTQTKENLLRKAYQRSLTEINAWHILIALPENASTDDTLKAWQKAMDVRERILKGEAFEQVARGTSDDQSVKINGGNLGYFTVFQMIMPFEDAVYSLKKGSISQPVRTSFGYHIIKVADKRPSKGKILVAHIMKNAPPGTSDSDVRKAEQEINSIYLDLKSGASFSDLAKKHSDHKESAVKGGVLNWFGAGEMISEFSEAAFALPDTGNFTKPFRTIYGWHIVKLLDKKGPGTFEESSSYLESKINQSYLYSLSKKSFTDKLKKEYKFRVNNIAYNWFIENTDTLVIQGLKGYDLSTLSASILYSFADQTLTPAEFAEYITKRGSMMITRDSSQFISRLLETCSSDQIISYENSILEKKYPEFRYLMNEFHDGILLFEISNKKVWNRINTDSLGLHAFYENHKYKYLSKKQIEARIITLKRADGDKALASAYKKFSGKADLDRRLMAKFNKKNDTVLFIKNGKWTEGDDPDIDKIEWTRGSHQIHKNGFPSIIIIKKVADPVPLKFEDVEEIMMTEYQEYLENDWIKQLKEKYNVKIDSFVLDEVKKKLINE